MNSVRLHQVIHDDEIGTEPDVATGGPRPLQAVLRRDLLCGGGALWLSAGKCPPKPIGFNVGVKVMRMPFRECLPAASDQDLHPRVAPNQPRRKAH